jgi:zinc transport system substrate-binding protein
MRISLLVLVFAFLACLAACGQGTSPGGDVAVATGKPRVYTVNYPLAWATEQLAGEFAEVHFPAPAGIDPAFWEPDRETIAAFQQADLILLNGANYAKWISKVSLPRNRMIDTSVGFADQYIAVDSGPVHTHGPEGGHSHGELAFTTWLDLSLYAMQVEAIAGALIALLPDEEAAITQRQLSLVSELVALDSKLIESGQRADGAPVLYSHPVYQYFDRRYGLNGLALHWEPDQVPTAKDWAELDAALERHDAKLMVWEDKPTEETRSGLSQRNIRLVVFRPMGNRSEGGNFGAGMLRNVAALAQALRVGG